MNKARFVPPFLEFQEVFQQHGIVLVEVRSHLSCTAKASLQIPE